MTRSSGRQPAKSPRKPSPSPRKEPRKQKVTWTDDEDRAITDHVGKVGATKWASIGLDGRTGKQCRERWLNQLNPDICRGPWTTKEDQAVMKAVAEHGPGQWSQIAKLIPGRTDNQIKNRYNSSLKKGSSDSSPVVAQRSPRKAAAKKSELNSKKAISKAKQSIPAKAKSPVRASRSKSEKSAPKKAQPAPASKSKTKGKGKNSAAKKRKAC